MKNMTPFGTKAIKLSPISNKKMKQTPDLAGDKSKVSIKSNYLNIKFQASTSVLEDLESSV